MFLFLSQRVGERFLDLGISSVLVAAMDVTSETPPPEVAITLPTLPAIVLLPGEDKGAPFRYLVCTIARYLFLVRTEVLIACEVQQQ